MDLNTRPAPGLSRIPYEIAFEIFMYLERYDLLALSQVSKALNVLTAPSIYRNFDVKINFERRGFTSFLKTIKRRPDLANHVKHIGTSGWLTALSALNRYQIYVDPHSKDFGAILHTLWNMECLTKKQKREWINGLKSRLFPAGYGKWRMANASIEKADTYLALLLVLLPNLESLDIYLPPFDQRFQRDRGNYWQLTHTRNIFRLHSSPTVQDNAKPLKELRTITISNDLEGTTQGSLRSEFLWPFLELPTLRSLGLYSKVIFFNSRNTSPTLPIEKLTLDEENSSYGQVYGLITECRHLEELTLWWPCYIPKGAMSYLDTDIISSAERVGEALAALKFRHSQNLRTLSFECHSIHGNRYDETNYGKENFWLDSPVPTTLPKFTALCRLRIDQFSLLMSYEQCDKLGIAFDAQLLYSLPTSLERFKVSLCTSRMIPILLQTSAQRGDALPRLQHVVAEFFFNLQG